MIWNCDYILLLAINKHFLIGKQANIIKCLPKRADLSTKGQIQGHQKAKNKKKETKTLLVA